MVWLKPMPGTKKNSGAKKSFGQHFLRDYSVVQKILAATDLNASCIVEVGPGKGALTAPLYQALEDLGRADRLVLIELDRDLLDELAERFPLAKIVHEDAAQVDWHAITAGKPWILVSNLPYNAGTAIVGNAFASNHPPEDAVVMLQKEVGERMLAQPPDMSLLSLVMQLMTTISRITTVKPGAFMPPPKVDSIVIRLKHHPLFAESEARDRVIALAKIGFANPRKQLQHNLKEAGVLDVDTAKQFLANKKRSPLARPSELSVQDWIDLFALVDQH